MTPNRRAPMVQKLRSLRPRALWQYLRDPKKPWGPKLAVLGAIAYLILPMDLIPDMPLIGFLDDLGVLTAAVAWLARNALADVDRAAAGGVREQAPRQGTSSS